MLIISNQIEGDSLGFTYVDVVESQGMIVRTLDPKRIKEPLSLAGLKLLQHMVGLLEKRNVMPDDILLTELVNGFIIEIPRIERSVVFRDFGEGVSCAAIRTPTHGSVVVIDGSNEEMERLEDMLTHDMEERECATGMTMMVSGAKNIPKPKIDVQGRATPVWYAEEVYRRSEQEVAAEREEGEQRKREIIERTKLRFSTVRDFMSIPDAGKVRIHDMRLNAIGGMFGIEDPEGRPEDRLRLAVKIYGEDSPGVSRATQIIMGTRMEVHGRAQRAMVR